MSDRDAEDKAGTKHQTLVRTEKRIIGYEDGNDPELEPLFANHFELLQIGTDVYLDIGVVRPADLVGLNQKIESAPSETHTITFNILQRIAMSRDGFERLKAGVDLIANAMKGERIGG